LVDDRKGQAGLLVSVSGSHSYALSEINTGKNGWVGDGNTGKQDKQDSASEGRPVESLRRYAMRIMMNDDFRR